MVAVKAGKLSHRDLFRGVLWTDVEWNAKRNELMVEANEDGFEEPDLFFETSRRMEQYQQTQPSLRERQQIVKRVLGSAKVESSSLSQDELAYVLEKLRGSNCDLGRSAHTKLSKLLK